MASSTPPGRLQPSGSSATSQSLATPNYTASNPPSSTDTCNVVIFGDCGVGKSSLVNLIARNDVAITSSDARGCTSVISEHETKIRNGTLKVKLFDTPGLNEGRCGTVPDKRARTILKQLVRTRMKQGNIHLIIYCVQGRKGERVIQALRKNYKLVHSIVKSEVPIVLVITSLESYEPDMEKWWGLNENTISRFGMTFAGHACVTTGMTTQSEVTEHKRKISYDAVCKLIEQCRLPNKMVAYTGPSPGTVPNVPPGGDTKSIRWKLNPKNWFNKKNKSGERAT